MFNPALDIIRREYSGPAAKEYVAQISRYHRIQASPGYRQAADFVAAELRRWGLDVAVHRYPARFDQHYWSAGMFQEWDCRAATLDVVAPHDQARKLADFREAPISVVQRSLAVDGEFAVVAVDGGARREDYAGLDVAGKLVLTRLNAEPVRRIAVEELGAVGVITDNMNVVPHIRPAGDLQDVRQYTSFWWTGHETPCFGFVLTPRQGAWLRGRLKQGEVRVRAHIDARLYAGEIEVIDAAIPGETGEEVVILSHLCHPAPGANDNGSGVGANMEVARTLATLVARGDLPRPRRTLRFLWMPEMTGTYAYLASHPQRLPRMVAGLNLDMVGADQDAVGSVSLIDSPPEALASFTPDLLERLRAEFTQETTSFGGHGGYALFRYASVPFSGGSDHYILSDPTVGVPCPMLIEWPDRYYHTSHDSLEKVSPTTLARNGGLAAGYAYWIATAGAAQARWLGEEMVSRGKGRILATLRAAADAALDAAETADRLAYRVEREQVALESLTRLAPDLPVETWQEDIALFAYGEGQTAARRLGEPVFATEEAVGDLAFTPASAAMARVPRRIYPGPVDLRSHSHKLTPDQRAALQPPGGGGFTLLTLALYWTDGRRSLAEIGRRVALESGSALPDSDLMGFYDALATMGLVEFVAQPAALTEGAHVP